jgi:hypothetical protein
MKPIIMWMKIMVVYTLLLEDYMHPTPQHNNALMAFKNNVYIAQNVNTMQER